MNTNTIRRHIVIALLTGAGVTLHAQTTDTKEPPIVVPADANGKKTIIAAPTNTKPLRIAIFEGKGAGETGIQLTETSLKSLPKATITRIKAADWATMDLKAFDLVVFTGGSGSAQAEAIGEAGRGNVREYVRNGGGYVGICAGAYLACSNFKWGLGILNASTVSNKWRRGGGTLDLEITEEGRKVAGDVKGTFKVRYNNGPIIKPGDRPDLPAYSTVALFRTEIAEFGSPVGVMTNSPAMAIGSFGKGRVFISSPHPEGTPGLEHFIPRGALWAAGVDAP